MTTEEKAMLIYLCLKATKATELVTKCSLADYQEIIKPLPVKFVDFDEVLHVYYEVLAKIEGTSNVMLINTIYADETL